MKQKLKKVLIICDSRLHKDPRVIRQYNAIHGKYEITTAGFTPMNETLRHFNIGFRLSFIKRLIRHFFLRLQLFKIYTWLNNRWYFGALVKDSVTYDIIICNEILTLPFVVKLKKKYPTKIWVDLHEFYDPQNAYHKFLVNNYVHQADYITTVCNCIVKEYKKEYNINVNSILTNATEHHPSLLPSETTDQIKLVHHGVAIAGRKIELMIEIMTFLPDNYQLSFYLSCPKEAQKQYLNELKQKAKDLNVVFHDPVPTSSLPKTLNQHDIGVYILPPRNLNNYCALPNKLFEFTQARLAIFVSPNLEMAHMVEDHLLGKVSKDYTSKSMADIILQTNNERIRFYKENAHQKAFDLSASKNEEIINEIIRGISVEV